MPADGTRDLLLVGLSSAVPAYRTQMSDRINFVLWFLKSASIAWLTNFKYRHSSKPFNVSGKWNLAACAAAYPYSSAQFYLRGEQGC